MTTYGRDDSKLFVEQIDPLMLDMWVIFLAFRRTLGACRP